MADWVHCNKCFNRFKANAAIKFYLLSCGHMHCQKCVQIMESAKICLVCKSPCDLLEISDNLKPEIRAFFMPAVDCIDKSKQNAHALIKHFAHKYAEAKKEIFRCYEIIRNLKTELKSQQQQFSQRMRRLELTYGNNLPMQGFVSSSVMSGHAPSSVDSPTLTPTTGAAAQRYMNMHRKGTPFGQWKPQRSSRMHSQLSAALNSSASQSETSFVQYRPHFGESDRSSGNRPVFRITPGRNTMTSLAGLHLGQEKKSHN